MMYDESFEVVAGGQKFYAFFNYTANSDGTYTSHCDLTNVGFFHDVAQGPGITPLNWGCYYGKMTAGGVAGAVRSVHTAVTAPRAVSPDSVVRRDATFAAAINAEQRLWTASQEPTFLGMPMREANRRKGQVKHQRHAATSVPRDRAAEAARDADIIRSLPTSWDWSDVQGLSYVCPVRNQGPTGGGGGGGTLVTAPTLTRMAWCRPVRLVLQFWVHRVPVQPHRHRHQWRHHRLLEPADGGLVLSLHAG